MVNSGWVENTNWTAKLLCAVFGISRPELTFDAHVELCSALKTFLDPREAFVLHLRFAQDATLAESAKRLPSKNGLRDCVSRERVRQIQAKALRKLRHPSRACYLKTLALTDGRSVKELLAERWA